MNPRSSCPLIFVVVIACSLLVGGSQAADGTTRVKRHKPTTRLSRELKLSVGQQVAVPGTRLRIKFTAVANDSRCPSDVTCVWAGNAAVKLELNGRGQGSSVTLNSSKAGQFVCEAAYQGYKVKLVELSPYPRSNRKIIPRDYRVTLLVSKG